MQMHHWLVIALFFHPLFSVAEGPSRKNLSEALRDLERSPEYQSTQSSLRAVEMNYSTRDLVLQPIAEIEGKRSNEARETYTQVSKPRSETLALTLTKPFSTGTQVKLIPSFEKAQIQALDPSERQAFDWQISISQNLWQDFFGRSTRLRWERERYQKLQEVAAVLRREAQLYVDFELLYWDWALAMRESELRSNNVRRGQEILRWVKDRYRRSAAESLDLLQAHALLNSRELQLATVAQTLNAVLARMYRFVPGVAWTPNPDELANARDPDALLAKWAGDGLNQPEPLELLEAQNAAGVADVKVKESRESIRPELKLQLAYGKNAIDMNRDTAISHALDESHEFNSISLVLKSGLDLTMEHRQVESARSERDSARQRREALESDATVAWKQLRRELEDLKKRIRVAEEYVKTQVSKAEAERQRYRTGRSTAFQSITFEQEAAEAEIMLWTLYASMRKTEARARLFAR
jgi:outer membrane protein TolC